MTLTDELADLDFQPAEPLCDVGRVWQAAQCTGEPVYVIGANPCVKCLDAPENTALTCQPCWDAIKVADCTVCLHTLTREQAFYIVRVIG